MAPIDRDALFSRESESFAVMKRGGNDGGRKHISSLSIRVKSVLEREREMRTHTHMPNVERIGTFMKKNKVRRSS